MLERIDKKTVAEKVVNHFINLIAEEKLKDGDKLLSERELAKELSIGRSALREGMRILEIIGFIEKRTDGAYIKTKDEPLLKEPINFYLSVQKTDFIDLLELRRILEIESVQMATLRATPTDIKLLTKLCDKMNECENDWEKYVKYNVDFHVLLAEMTGNSIILDIFNSTRDKLSEYQKTVVSNREILETSLLHHLQLVDAIKNKDVELAKEIIENHLAFSSTLVSGYLMEKGE